ncbi:hypothetical protein [Pseudomonas syringae]
MIVGLVGLIPHDLMLAPEVLHMVVEIVGSNCSNRFLATFSTIVERI